jgi:hypothetical protein
MVLCFSLGRCAFPDAEHGSTAKDRAHRGKQAASCYVVPLIRKLGEKQVKSFLYGRFDLTLQRDSVFASGLLELTGTGPIGPASRSDTPISPLYGWSTISLDTLGKLQIAISPSQRDSIVPGIQVLFFPTDSSLLILMGGPMVPEHLTLDAGVVLNVEGAAQSGFMGRWEATDAAGSSVRGSFCARRIT